MSRTDLEPFDRLQVLTTEIDEIEVAHLLQVNPNIRLICQDCGGRRFTAEGFIPVGLEILTGEHIVVSHIDYKKVVVNRVLRCSHCGSEDLITITNPEENDGQQNSARSSGDI